jgi:hypothetical protein
VRRGKSAGSPWNPEGGASGEILSRDQLGNRSSEAKVKREVVNLEILGGLAGLWIFPQCYVMMPLVDLLFLGITYSYFLAIHVSQSGCVIDGETPLTVMRSNSIE